jgi:hypothetical protein
MSGKLAAQRSSRKMENSISPVTRTRPSIAMNYLKIDGNLTIIGAKTLEFEGVIDVRVDYIDNGKPYIRDGKQLFTISGKRKYWRMHSSMSRPDGEYTVLDYIDIHFEKLKK